METFFPANLLMNCFIIGWLATCTYLPYKVYLLLATMRVIRGNMTVLQAFIVISFLNRCLNPFIYASQYEVVRRTWAPMVEFLRARVVRIRQLAASGAAARTRIGQGSTSVPSRHQTAGQKLPMSARKEERNESQHRMRQSKIFVEGQLQLRK